MTDKICMMCGKPSDKFDFMIEGNFGCICPDCAKLIAKIANENDTSKTVKEDNKEVNIKEVPKPKEIKAFLDEYVIGQDKVKQRIATAVYNHYKRIGNKYDTDDVEIQKSNILVCGPTGTGKTYIAQTIARMLNVPFAIADATSITESGYVGDDVESILAKLLQAADGDVERAQKGIVFIDEIDKIAKRSSGTSITRDVSGEGVQQALLKLLEGSIIGVPPNGGRKHPEQKLVNIDTKNILFICGGAFDGLEQIIDRRNNNYSVGFGQEHKVKDEEEHIGQITAQDIRQFGLIPEFIGRLPIIVHTEALDEDALYKILTEPKNALLKQYKKLFKIDGVDLTIDKNVLRLIANQAIESKTGARGLRGIMENLMDTAMYEMPSSDETKLRITMKYAKKQLGDTIKAA